MVWQDDAQVWKRQASLSEASLAHNPMGSLRWSPRELLEKGWHRLLGLEARACTPHLRLAAYPGRAAALRDVTAYFNIGVCRVLLVSGHHDLHRGSELMGLVGDVASHFPSLKIAVAFDPYSVDLESELKRLEEKFRHGAHEVWTQPVVDVETLHKLAVWRESWGRRVAISLRSPQEFSMWPRFEAQYRAKVVTYSGYNVGTWAELGSLARCLDFDVLCG